MHRPGIVVLIGVLLLSLPSAHAADASHAREKVREARAACLAGNPILGATLLAELYVDTREPNYIYNQARCFEQNHRYEDAVSRYREFLKLSPDIAEKERAAVEKQIAECEGFLQRPAKEVEPTPPPPPDTPKETEDPIAPDAITTPASPVVTPVVDSLALRIAGIGSGAIGLAAIGTAIYFHSRARSLSDRITHSSDPSAADFRAGQNAETMQWVFYGVGAAALATGSVLCYFGWRSAAPNAVAITPVIAPGMAGLAAGGAL